MDEQKIDEFCEAMKSFWDKCPKEFRDQLEMILSFAKNGELTKDALLQTALCACEAFHNLSVLPQ